jgi:hypothetical protein
MIWQIRHGNPTKLSTQWILVGADASLYADRQIDRVTQGRAVGTASHSRTLIGHFNGCLARQDLFFCLYPQLL